MFDKKTYMARRAQLKKDVKSGLIVFPANEEASANYAANTYPFRQDSNFLYFSVCRNRVWSGSSTWTPIRIGFTPTI